MSIQPVNAAPNRSERASAEAGGTAPTRPASTGAAGAASATSASHVAPESAHPVAPASAIPSEAELKQAVANINKSLQTLAQDLVFSVDEDSHRTIVKVVDQTTQEVIRQMPSPEALALSKALDAGKGLLIKQTA